MTRALFWLCLTVLGLGAFFWVMTSQGSLETAFHSLGITLPESAWMAQIIKLIVNLCVLLLVGLPFTLFLFSFADVGSDEASTDIHGYTELRLKSGTRTMTILMVGFLLFVFAMAFEESESIIAQCFAAVGGLFFLWAGVWLLRLTVRFDQSVMIAPDYLARVHRHEWRDLERYAYNKDAMEFHFWFADGKRARASRYLSGVEDLVAHANRVLTS